MAEDTPGQRALSLSLSRALDEIGLNKLTIKKRRRTFLLRENFQSVNGMFTGDEMKVYHFGSQSEGATTLGLGSDRDSLCCFAGVNVALNWPEWEQGQINLLMLQEHTAPGYCRLQCLRSDIPMAREDMPGADHYEFDSSGRLLMKNTFLAQQKAVGADARNGPALSNMGDPGFCDDDLVPAFLCRSWPTQAGQFIRRRRRHGWPPPDLIGQAVEHGVFIVPVGYKLSQTEPLEWRISASPAERDFMFSLTSVHIKCYAVMKMLRKTFIEPRVEKCISSYHCKTALLYCTEKTEPGFWRDENLIQCVTQCLMLLHTWVTDGFCPQFIISEENLFAGKVTAQNRGELQSILHELIHSTGHVLLRVNIDNLGQMLQTRINTRPSVMPILDSCITTMLITLIEIDTQVEINATLIDIVVKNKSATPATAIRFVCQHIRRLRQRHRQCNKYERQATEVLLEFLLCWLGSLLASVSLSHKTRIPRVVRKLFRQGAKSDVASQLKLASIFYVSGDLRKAKTLLRKIEEHVGRYKVMSTCGCYVYGKGSMPSDEFCNQLHGLGGRRTTAKMFAHCVRFSPQEIYCAPPTLYSEYFRSVGDDLRRRDPVQDKWMDLAAVDSLPFLYILQYLTYRQLGKHDLQKRSLHNLDSCIREDHSFGHLETSWNLLGHCMELEQDPDAAIACYRTSLEVRPRNNAANWHVAILCYRIWKTSAL